ncbi:CLAVATA3/ESR (CLE)-related protein TDIF [Tripterygium wilfordii]|uniref:CLAVATA3/ESR (CLE)-related protein TDIF n=1 Tax=Tripterygium wilfordii TaxID=458696 RepID=UPI0018F7F5B4|nr:CLAVATA3/ESR (CLE)-related protein TDIF [Tripterygium wilfordii]
MDIEPLWTLGGWFLLFINCMAKTAPSSSSSETSTKSNTPLLFLLLLLLVFVLLTISPKSNPINPTNSNTLRRRLLSEHPSESSSPTTASTMKLHPKHDATTAQKSRSREFGAAAHEVPSGPNPISNR